MKIITHRTWIDPDLCDFIYLPEYDEEVPKTIPPDKSIVYCPMDQIADFFRLIENTNNKYTLISANSDYGLHLQSEDPVERDMQKWLPMQDVTGIGYNTAVIPARCNPDRCKKSDKYSVKIYSFTRDTFDKIPENIDAWFATNVNVPDDPIIRLPFGVGEKQTDILSYATSLEEKENRVYINWTNNTNERLEIKRVYQNHPMVYFDKQRPYEEYLTEMANSRFVMCPEGNGLDSYRVWEALYLGCIPIVHRDNWSDWMYSNLPVCIPNHRGIPHPDQLNAVYKEIQDSLEVYNKNGFKYDPLNTTLNYEWWKQTIKEDNDRLSNI